MTKFDDCEEAVNLLNNVKGSIENKIRTAYNLGYKEGKEQSRTDALVELIACANKLWETAEQNEPQTERSKI